uniref:(northern house mosquito) hypothetical protein n=1 Tax=Culex pipiens TaxID=7175 RepID=A0A8D8IKL4_CULPI
MADDAEEAAGFLEEMENRISGAAAGAIKALETTGADQDRPTCRDPGRKSTAYSLEDGPDRRTSSWSRWRGAGRHPEDRHELPDETCGEDLHPTFAYRARCTITLT